MFGLEEVSTGPGSGFEITKLLSHYWMRRCV